ncbi:hypothetical protein Btru_066179 [Bulinus truncatus]|nr:hypothetical protein Btru_066179 [Bulinus truncatus]
MKIHMARFDNLFRFTRFPGSDSTFPLIDCETKETVIVFQVDCQHLIHEQSKFIQNLEHFLRKEKHWKIVQLRYLIAGVTNNTAWHFEITLNSSSLLTETAALECRNDAFSKRLAYMKFETIKYRVMFMFLDSRKAMLDKAFIKSAMLGNRNVQHKMFIITERNVSANFIYRTDSYKNLEVHEVYQKMCDSKYSIVNTFLCEKTKSEREKLNDQPENKMNMVCLQQEMCHDNEIKKFEPINQLLNNATDGSLDSLQSNVKFLNVVCSFQIENLTQLKQSENSWYCNIERVSQFNNRSMTIRIEKCRKIFSCPLNYYQCLDSYCVDLGKLVDGQNDCPLGDDERFFGERFICTGDFRIKSKEISYQSQCPYSNVTKNEYLTSKIKKTNGLNETVSIEVKELKIYFINASHSLVPQRPVLLLYFPIVDILQIESTECKITDFETAFKYWDTSKLVSLNLKKNLLTNLDFLVNMSELRHIDLSYNEHLTIGDKFQFPGSLKYIDLSYTNIHSLSSGAFNNLQELNILNVSNTKIQKFENIKLPSNFKLHTLNIRGLVMVDVHANYFEDLIIDSQILADDYRLCCLIILGVNIDQDKCIAPNDVISSCQHLVGDTFKRITIWIVGLITLVGNGAVMAYRIKWSQWTFTKAYDIFIMGLAVSDFMMGVYLIMVAIVDVHYREMYVLKHAEWKRGNLCTFSGFLSTLSSEMSTFFICLITIDRFLAITYPFGEHKFSEIGIKLTLVFVWLTGCILALIPAVYPGWEIYSSNALCLPFPLSTQRFTGWQYSVAIFIFLNFILFLIIAFGQIAIFLSVTKSKGSLICKQYNPKARSQEINIAKKLAFVAVSDFLCWFPIGIMGMFTLNGYEFNPEVYAWMAVFVLPVNSALNPFIYTIPAIYNRFKN